MNHLFATKFYFHFSGNPPNITGNLIFYCNKRKKLMKISVIELLHGLFVYFGWVIGRMPKIMQNGPQTRSTPTSNERKKHGPRCCTGKQRIPSTDMWKCMKTRSFLSFPVLFFFKLWVPKSYEAIQNVSKLSRSNMHLCVAMIEFWFNIMSIY